MYKKISVHFSSKEIVSATVLLPTQTGQREMKRKGDTTITIVSPLYSYIHVPKEKIVCQLLKL